MRVISGKFKGKSISFLKSKITRPLKDSVKENIFNIITHSNLLNINLKKSNILDLYSGVGSFGIECISRDANKVVFVERDNSAVETLNKNLFNLSIKNKATVINEEIVSFLNKKKLKKFDIFFLDPPFADKYFLDKLKLIKQKKIYKSNHILIIHRENKSSDNFKNLINPLIVKKYGRSKIIFGKFLD